MTAPITLYTFEDANGTEDDYSTLNWADAHEYALTYSRRIIGNEYEWQDSEVIEDHTGSDDPCPEVDELGMVVRHEDGCPEQYGQND